MRFINLFTFTLVVTFELAASAPDRKLPNSTIITKHVNKQLQKEPSDYESREIKANQFKVKRNLGAKPLKPELKEGRMAKVPLVFDENWHRYYANLSISEPERWFLFAIDTTSSLFWVPSIDCTSCLNEHKYELSSTSKVIDYVFETEHESPYITGQAFEDTIIIGGFTISKYKFGAVNYIEGYGRRQWDGLLGLSITPVALWGRSLLLEMWIKKQIDFHGFGLHFGGNMGSELIIGGYDENKISWDNLKWSPVIESPHWTIFLQAVQVGRERVPIRYNRAIIDASASYIHAYNEDYDAFYSAFPDIKYGERYPCKYPPDIGFIIGHVLYQIGDIRKPGSAEDNQRYCNAVVIGSTHHPGWVLGTPFLENVYAVFDITNGQIGLFSLFKSARWWSFNSFNYH